ncbi:MAG TPA: hypothetical protein PK908_06940, partial [Bacteroidales bacterium]|nr:hypothetical protein [Bacteroidales bacterium]
MKKYIVLLGLVMFIGGTAMAQWTKTGTTIHPTTISDKLGVGTNNAEAPLQVHMTAQGLSQLQRMVANTGAGAGITFDKARAGETAAGAADYMGSFVGRLHDGSNYTPRAAIRFQADGSSTTGKIIFQTHDGGGVGLGQLNRMIIDKNGKVGIGVADMTKLGDALLGVNGKILATEVEVKLFGNWPDFVFLKDYKLMPLNEVEQFINENGHLPNVPSELQVKEDGINLGQMNAVLLQKIEELTLHI